MADIFPLEEVLEDDWYKNLSPDLQAAVRAFPPNRYYWLNGVSECHIKAYAVTHDDEFEFTVTKTGRGHWLRSINQNDVFGVKAADLHLEHNNPELLKRLDEREKRS